MRSFSTVLLVAAAACSCSSSDDGGARLTGIVRADESVVVAPVAGTLVELSIRRGERVEAGATVARIAPPAAGAELERLRAAVSAAETAARNARGRRAQAEDDLAEIEAEALAGRRRVTAGRVVESSSDTTLLRWDLAKNRLMAAQALESAAERATAEARAAAAAAFAEPTRVAAPDGGEVAVVAGPLGRAVRAGEPLATLYRPGPPWVSVAVEESLAAALAPGDRLATELADGRILAAEIESIGPAPAFAVQRDADRRRRDIRAFEVRLRLLDADGVRPGMTAYVRLGER